MKFLKKIFGTNYLTKTQYVIDIKTLCNLWMSSANTDSVKQYSSPKTEVDIEQHSHQSTASILSVYGALKDIIDPVENLIKSKEAWTGLMKVFDIVEKYGSYPSVVVSKDEIEYNSDVISILSNVTIKEHSIKVARLMVDEMKKVYKNTDGLVLIAVLAGLMHDIGKAEPLRASPQYSKYNHPLTSADLLRSCFASEGVDLYDVNKAIDIIQNHHKVTNDQLTSLFQLADERARIDELKSAHKIVLELDEALSPGDILKLIEPEVNVPRSEKDWRAFSFRDIVYVEPSFLYELILIYSKEKNIFIANQIKKLSESYCLKKIVDMLKNVNMLAPVKLSHEHGGWFDIYFDSTASVPMIKKFLIPIKVTSFGKLPSDFDERKFIQHKSGLIKFISSVTPSKGVK